PHPHGQIYAFPFIPSRIEKEIAAARAHRRKHGRCVFCDVLKKERRGGERMVAENDAFTAFIPFYARWPYEVHIYSRRHLGTLEAFRPAEERALAEMLKWVTLKYDNLYHMSFPYMMVLHQAPARGRHDDFHFHIEFYPPHRSKEKLKYLASVETGGGSFLNDSLAEEKAAELRSIRPRRRREIPRL
ncbi:MAG: galactose-1-phosphate uridylyltransferase, partial [Methylocella sp.]